MAFCSEPGPYPEEFWNCAGGQVVGLLVGVDGRAGGEQPVETGCTLRRGAPGP
jgi:hypothetical protein